MTSDDDSSLVVCARCGKQLPRSAADVVTAGAGYECQRCSLDEQVHGHLRQAAANEAAHKRGRSRLDATNPHEPCLKQVVALVEEAEEQPVVESVDEAALGPEAIEPVIAADETEADDFARVSSLAASPPSPLSPPSPVGDLNGGAAPKRPRYICIVCFRVASDAASECPEDRVPLSDLEDPRAVAELRARVRRRANRREAWRFGTIFVGASVLSLMICLYFDIGFGHLHFGQRNSVPVVIGMLIAAPLYLVSLRLAPQLRVRNDVAAMLAAVGLDCNPSE